MKINTYMKLMLSVALNSLSINATVPTQSYFNGQMIEENQFDKSHKKLKKLYGFSFLEVKGLSLKLKEEEFLKKNEGNKIKEGLREYLTKKYTEAENILFPLAEKGSSQALYWLGKINKEQNNISDALNYFFLSVKTDYLLGQKKIWEKSLTEINSLLKTKLNQDNKNIIEFFLNSEYKLIVKSFVTASEDTPNKFLLNYQDTKLKLAIFLHNLSNFYFQYNLPLSYRSLLDQQFLSLLLLSDHKDLMADLGVDYSRQGDKKRAAFYYRKSQTKLSFYNLAYLIKFDNIDEDEDGKIIQDHKKYEVIARLCRKSQSPEGLTELATCIRDGYVDRDEKGNVFKKEDKNNIAARLYRQANIPTAKLKLATMIANDETQKDGNNKPINANEKYLIAARIFKELYINEKLNAALNEFSSLIYKKMFDEDLNGKLIQNDEERYRIAKNYYKIAGIPEAYNNLGNMINEGNLLEDISGKPIEPSEKYKVAAEYYRKAGIPIAYYNFGKIICDGNLLEDINGKTIEPSEKYKAAAECYRKAGVPAAYFNLGFMINEGNLLEDINGKPIKQGKKYKVAAECYRKAGVPAAYFNLGVMIKDGQLLEDMNGKPIKQGEKYKVAAECFRKAGTPKALYELAILIKAGHINVNEKNEAIHPSQRNEEAARLYRLSKTAASLHNLGAMIFHSEIHRNENDIPFPENQRYEVAARLFLQSYKESSSPMTLNNLGALVLCGLISHDENNNKFSKKERYEVAARLLKQSNTAEGYENLSKLELKKLRPNMLREDQLKILTQAKDYALKAITMGAQSAKFCYEDILKEIEKLEPELQKKRELSREEEFESDDEESQGSLSIQEDKHQDMIEEGPKQETIATSFEGERAQDAPAIHDLKDFTQDKKSEKKRHEKEKYSTQEYKDKKRKYKEKLLKIKKGEKLTLEDMKMSKVSGLKEEKISFIWSNEAQKDYSKLNSFEIKRINFLLDRYSHNDFSRGNYEKLVNKPNSFSARITKKHRLVLKQINDTQYEILGCFGHY